MVDALLTKAKTDMPENQPENEIAITIDELLGKAKTYLPESKIAAIKEAYEFAAAAHKGQERKSKEPYIVHPLQVAMFLAELRLDANALVAALLHDVVEDCHHIGIEDISLRFGEEAAKLVDGVTKITQAEALMQDSARGLPEEPDDRLAKAATIRKLFVAMASDVRVVIIKLADRLHNMQTLRFLSHNRRLAIAQETLEIYAPLAHRIGMWEFKWRLEDLALKHLNPGAHKDISRMLNATRREREEYIDVVRSTLQADLDAAGIAAEVTGRPKSIYSIYKKIEKYRRQNLGVDDIYDLFALRVLVREVQDCYRALGVVHARWRPVPGQFDDYIANPKDNHYKSLHTTVQCMDANPVEVQIRTIEMHRVAEYGVAAHWLYKDGSNSDAEFDEKMTWIKQILDWLRDVGGAEEFVESFKTDIFQNQVAVYTPAGDLRELTAGATPLDFAYRIHTELGHRCIGAKVNGKLASFTYQLQNGDTVEIMTSKASDGPSRDWLNPNLGYINTKSAQTKVRQWFNRQGRKVNIESGKDIFRIRLRRLNPDMSAADIATILKFATTDEFLAALGNGDITVPHVVDRIANPRNYSDDALYKRIAQPSATSVSKAEVVGLGELSYRMAKCCEPAPGDDITAYINRDDSAAVHSVNCRAIASETDNDHLTPVDWKIQTLYPVTLCAEADDRVGLLNDIISLVSQEGVNIEECHSDEKTKQGTSIISLTVFVSGMNQLHRLCFKMDRVRGMLSLTRGEEEGAVQPAPADAADARSAA